MCIYVLYAGLFSPYAIFARLHLLTGSSRLEFVQTQLCLKKNKLRIENQPVINSLAENEGETGENKTATNVSLHTVNGDDKNSLPLEED